MSDFDFKKQVQDYFAKGPAIVLGSGASAAYGIPGMGQLGTHLIATVKTDDLSGEEIEGWSLFCELLEQGTGLEEALHRARLSTAITSRVVESTWELICPADEKVFLEGVADKNRFALSDLLRQIVRSDINEISIITTNYDCLAEYACEQIKLHHFTGFSFGALRTMSPKGRVRTDKQANIWKVHGSIDWFDGPDKTTIGLTRSRSIPAEHVPKIVTPGIEKYRLTHGEPFRTVIQEADRAIMQENSYLCVGFGFNDEHIQPKLKDRCTSDRIPITVITRDLTQSAREFLLQGDIKNYIAIERGASDNESIVYSSLTDEPITVQENLWSLDGLNTIII